MPAGLRARVSRATSSSRPYDRRSPTASPLQLESPLAHSQSPPPTPPIQDPEIPLDQPGLPTYAEYKQIETTYLHSLSPRKRDKALITQAMFDKIWDVLHQPEACTIETPQFRFWVRKMFTLSRPVNGKWAIDGGTESRSGSDSGDDEASSLALERAMGIGLGASNDPPNAVVLHEHRPVAIVEQLYELLCYCHARAGHGGRDKTCAVIRQHYSWVPKELTAQFVKACPTCASKRSGGIRTGVDMVKMTRYHGQVEHRRGNRGRETVSLGGEEKPKVPLTVGWWPTTGGPLDPENPELSGVRERLRTREETRAAGLPSSPAFTASGSNGRTRSETHELMPFPLSVHDTTHAGRSQAISVNNITTIVSPRRMKNEEPTGSPSRLPSLATALSNSFDETLAPFVDGDVRVRSAGEHDGTGECLPPALRPLRLLGPVTESDAKRPPCILQIDPVLLSFHYPGTNLSGGLLIDTGVAFSEPGRGVTASGTVDLNMSGARVPHALSSSPEGQGCTVCTRADATIVRVGGMSTGDVFRSPGLYPAMPIQSVIQMSSPDRPSSDAYPDNVVQCPSNVSLSRNRRHGSGYAPSLAMFLPCAMEEVTVGQLELDGTPLSTDT